MFAFSALTLWVDL